MRKNHSAVRIVKNRMDPYSVQGSSKRWALGCVNSPPAARGSQEAGITQPRAHLLADSCTVLGFHTPPGLTFQPNIAQFHCIICQSSKPVIRSKRTPRRAAWDCVFTCPLGHLDNCGQVSLPDIERRNRLRPSDRVCSMLGLCARYRYVWSG